MTAMAVIVYILLVSVVSFLVAVVLFIISVFFVKKKRRLFLRIWIVLSVIVGLFNCAAILRRCQSATGVARSIAGIPRVKGPARQIDAKFILAAAKSDLDAMQELLNKGADINASDSQDLTALRWAAANGDRMTVQFLLKNGARVNENSSGIEGSLPLLLAARIGDTEMARLLLEHGASLLSKDRGGMCVLMVAAETGNFGVAELLVESGIDVNVRDNSGSTALMAAAEAGNARILSFLLQKGADVNVVNVNGYTAMTFAAGSGHKEIVSTLVKDKRWNEVRTSFGRALAVAVGFGHKEAALILINAGADPNLRSAKFGRTALIVAADKGYADIVKALIDKGADIDAQDSFGKTALQWAKDKSHGAIVEILKNAR
ncbi:ankyrin repeat domain-containing protein [Candidatus Pacearchaeota archaeon]|nr:ankyrin repeat domain-containing protein [Candidatus Pacearchaeota archaeon]